MDTPVPTVENDFVNQEPVVITASLNDGVDPDLPSVPRTVDEIVDSAVRSYEEGAAIAHLHGIYDREYTDEGWKLLIDEEKWGAIVDGIRSRCDMIVQLGLTGAANRRPPGMEAVKVAKPDMMSVTLGEYNNHRDGKDVNVHFPRSEMKETTEYLRDNGIIPELEVFQPGTVWNIEYLIKEGAIEPPYWANFLFGVTGTNWLPATPTHLNACRELLPDSSRWTVTHFCGAKGSGEPGHQRRFHANALSLGEHVRIGIEENADYRTEPPEEATATLVSEIADLADMLDRGVATPDEAREMVGLS